MEILFILIPVSLVLVMISLAAFVWSVHNRQYDDLDKEAHRILFDETAAVTPVTRTATSVNTTKKSTQKAPLNSEEETS